MFSYEFCQISTNPFSYRTPPMAASAEAYSEPCQTLKMVFFAKIVNDCKSLTIFKCFIWDAWQGSEYASAEYKGNW